MKIKSLRGERQKGRDWISGGLEDRAGSLGWEVGENEVAKESNDWKAFITYICHTNLITTFKILK